MTAVTHKEKTQTKIASKRFGLKRFIILSALVGVGYYFFFFVINANFKEVVANKIYRSGQPSPKHLKRWVEQYGIKTVINLRGSSEKEIEQEQSVADELGIKLVSIYLSAKRLATKSELSQLINAIESTETPILLHCRSGIDRAGTASALAAMAIGDVDYDRAIQQAYVAPGPWKRKDFSKSRPDYIHNYAHISDIFKFYESYCEQKKLDPNNWQQFKRWVVEMNPFEDKKIEYKSTYSYFPLFQQGKRFFPIRKLARQAYIQFTLELLIISLFLIVIHRQMTYNKNQEPNKKTGHVK